jgi:hypothetical protein
MSGERFEPPVANFAGVPDDGETGTPAISDVQRPRQHLNTVRAER